MQKRGLIFGIIILGVIIVGALIWGGYYIFNNKLNKYFITTEEKENLNASDEIVIEISPKNDCSVNSDCVPASCCHATSCTNKENAPICDKIFCTKQCVPGTLDCGQASCECIDDKCEVILNGDGER